MLLSGTKLNPLTAARGVELWILSAQGFHASRGVLPETAPASQMTGGSGRTSRALSKNQTRNSYFWKMSQDCLFETGSTRLSRNLRHWATKFADHYYLPPPMLAPVTAVSEFTFWPTARANDAQGSDRMNQRNGITLPTLTGAATEWQTPKAAVGNKIRGGDRSGELLLNGQAANWPTAEASLQKSNKREEGRPRSILLTGAVEAWSTPKAITGGANSQRELRDGTGGPDLQEQIKNWHSPSMADHRASTPLAAMETKSSDQRLRNQIHNWPTAKNRDWKGGKGAKDRNSPDLDKVAEFHFSHPDQTSSINGATSSEARRRLNPRFVEWLMNWPIGWTGFDFAETEWSRWLQQSRSAYSAIERALFSKPPRRKTPQTRKTYDPRAL